MSTQHYAIGAKLKAMSRSLLKRDDYEALLEARNVGEVCKYLKDFTVYSDVLSEIHEEEIHRMELELFLNEQFYSEYKRIFKFLGLYERKAFNFYIIKKELEYIKHGIKKVFGTMGIGENTLAAPDEFFYAHTKLNMELLMKAEDFNTVMEACRNTVYYKMLYRDNMAEIKYEAIVIILDIYYYRLLWKEVLRFIEKPRQKDLLDLFGQKIDLLNILWVYRCKKYFDMSKDMIYTHIIPINYKIKKDVLVEMVSEDADNIPEIINKTYYKGLFDGMSESDFVDENYRRVIYDIIKKKFQTAKEPVTLAVSYFLLKNNEIQNIKTITEGKRYSFKTGNIKELIVY